ncbi:MAG: hypothetical protein DSY90_05985 [Deltaproteobacteria bacterium]|nr:MAG: hypothetical protein DSY90_05985 [Deltaproteobacteria bacterium]
MIIICEECGKKYQTTGTLKKERVKFKCRSCSHIITISQADVIPDSANGETAADLQSIMLSSPDEEITGIADEQRISPDSLDQTMAGLKLDTGEASGDSGDTDVDPGLPGKKGLGLRTKMMFLFLVVPIALFSISGAYYLMQMKQFSNTLTSESIEVVKKMGENRIREVARIVAGECKQYLLDHPELSKEQFMSNADFKKMSIQRVGLTGYTTLFSIGPYTSWTHPNRRIVGKPLAPLLRKPLGKEFGRFFEIIKEIEKGNNEENSGYYLWQDPDGALREKFMVVTPLEGTQFGIAATVYLDEFIRPINKIVKKAEKNTLATRNIILAILGITLLLMAIIVFFYAHRITGRIKNLTDLAERISVGEMDTEIKIDSNDEIGSLGEAISRMQRSIRLSIERLRRR